MKSWELSKNIIAFFQSFPYLQSRKLSFFSTVISQDFSLYQTHHSSFDNPEFKSDPFEIIEEITQLLQILPRQEIAIDLMTNLDYVVSEHHKTIFTTFVIPMIQALASYRDISSYRESKIDIFSLQGLFDSTNRSIISDMVNTVIYV